MSKKKCPLAKRKTRENVFGISWKVNFSFDVKVELYGQKRKKKEKGGGLAVKEGKKKEKQTLCLIRPPSSKNVVKVSSMECYWSGEESNKGFSP